MHAAITSNGLSICVGGRELLKCSLTDIFLLFLLLTGQSERLATELGCVYVFGRLFRGRGGGAGTGGGSLSPRVQLGAE